MAEERKIERSDAKPPECPFELPVTADGEYLRDADGGILMQATLAWVDYLAWVINSHIEVTELQDRMQNLIARRNLESVSSL